MTTNWTTYLINNLSQEIKQSITPDIDKIFINTTTILENKINNEDTEKIFNRAKSFYSKSVIIDVCMDMSKWWSSFIVKQFFSSQYDINKRLKYMNELISNINPQKQNDFISTIFAEIKESDKRIGIIDRLDISLVLLLWLSEIYKDKEFFLVESLENMRVISLKLVKKYFYDKYLLSDVVWRNLLCLLPLFINCGMPILLMTQTKSTDSFISGVIKYISDINFPIIVEIKNDDEKMKKNEYGLSISLINIIFNRMLNDEKESVQKIKTSIKENSSSLTLCKNLKNSGLTRVDILVSDPKLLTELVKNYMTSILELYLLFNGNSISNHGELTDSPNVGTIISFLERIIKKYGNDNNYLTIPKKDVVISEKNKINDILRYDPIII